jgi:SPP1 gp7 family putative phage head morphogenesis protein
MTPAEFVQLPPEAAIKHMRSRGVMLPDNYYAQAGAYRMTSFTVSRVVAIDSLQGVLDGLTQALESGENFRTWKKRAIADPNIGALPPGQLDNVFRTNMQGAYHRGIYQRQAEVRSSRPYLMFDAINDGRTRPSHRAMDNFIARWDDPIWATHRPPLGFRCRCTLITLNEKQAQDRGLGSQARPTVKPDPGWEYDRAEGIEPGVKKARARAERKPVAVAAAKNLPKPARGGDWWANRAMHPVDDWKQIGEQRGSNAGGLFESPDGRRFYVKFPTNPDHARAEVLGDLTYASARLDTLDAFLVTKDGKLGVATKWREDLRRLTPEEMAAPTGKLREDLAATYLASVATKNWDVAGLSLDNVHVSTVTGRLVVGDPGASFTFRAQGGGKAYGPDIDELRTLIDPQINPQTARVFGAVANDPILLERVAQRWLAGGDEIAIRTASQKMRLDGPWLDSVMPSLTARKAALADRFDAFGSLRPVSFGAFHDKLYERHGGDRLTKLGRDPDGKAYYGADAQVPVDAINLAARLMKSDVEPEFRRIGIDPSTVQSLFSDWSGDSSSLGGAVMKLWASRRLGVGVTYHNRTSGALTAVIADAERWERYSGVKLDKILAALDVEYDFTQYLLRRAFGHDTIPVRRFMVKDEFDSQYADGQYRSNAVTSTAYPEGGYTNSRAVTIAARVEDFAKLYWQGVDYMAFGSSEREFVMVGRTRPATVLR